MKRVRIGGPDLLWFDLDRARLVLELEHVAGRPAGRVWETWVGNYVLEDVEGEFHGWSAYVARQIGLILGEGVGAIEDPKLAAAVRSALDAGER